jgi:hypothetical protein
MRETIGRRLALPQRRARMAAQKIEIGVVLYRWRRFDCRQRFARPALLEQDRRKIAARERIVRKTLAGFPGKALGRAEIARAKRLDEGR